MKLLLAPAFMVALAASPSPPARPAVTVHIHNFAFVPASETVAAGSTIRFVNDDDEAHTVTSAAKAFDSGGLDSNEHWDHVFTQAGRYAYFCALHPQMTGVVIVK